MRASPTWAAPVTINEPMIKALVLTVLVGLICIGVAYSPIGDAIGSLLQGKSKKHLRERVDFLEDEVQNLRDRQEFDEQLRGD